MFFLLVAFALSSAFAAEGIEKKIELLPAFVGADEVSPSAVSQWMTKVGITKAKTFDDGDFIVEIEGKKILIGFNKTDISLSSSWQATEGTSDNRRFRFAHNMSKDYKFVQVSFPNSDSMRIEHSVDMENGVSPRQFVSTLLRFATGVKIVVGKANEEDLLD